MSIKCVIFDMDGTITDSERFARSCMERAMKEVGYDKWTDSFYDQLLGANHVRFNAILLGELNSQSVVDTVMENFSNYVFEGLKDHQVKFKKGALELMQYLKENDIPMVLCTSSSYQKVQLSFEGNDMEVPFKHIVTGTDVHHSKPNPEIFLIGARKANVDIKDCMIIEDSYNGMQAAIASGAVSVMVPDILPPTEYIKENASFIFEDLTQVKKYLESLNKN